MKGNGRKIRVATIVEKAMIYRVGESQQTLIISKNVIEHFIRHQQKGKFALEAGGQLFAHFSNDTIIISAVTGPRITDSRSLQEYSGDRKSEQEEINNWFLRGYHYVGDWHTHPEAIPKLSNIDKITMTSIFTNSKHSLNAMVCIIVGTKPFPRGLNVSIHNDKNWIKLSHN